MFSTKSIATAFLLLIYSVTVAESNIDRIKRGLLFPQANPTRLQFIAGFGIPVDLELESVTVGYVFKAQYFLPYNATHWRPEELMPIRDKRANFDQDFNGIFKSDNLDESPYYYTNQPNPHSEWYNVKYSRWILYEYIEILLDRQGFCGRSCLLRAICEFGQMPFHYDSGMLAELIQVILTPSSTRDSESEYFSESDEYANAELLGKRDKQCDELYKGCPISPLDLFSNVLL